MSASRERGKRERERWERQRQDDDTFLRCTIREGWEGRCLFRGRPESTFYEPVTHRNGFSVPGPFLLSLFSVHSRARSLSLLCATSSLPTRIRREEREEKRREDAADVSAPALGERRAKWRKAARVIMLKECLVFSKRASVYRVSCHRTEREAMSSITKQREAQCRASQNRSATFLHEPVTHRNGSSLSLPFLLSI